jgi:hypothetical protein
MYEKQDVEALEKQFNAAMEEADTGSASTPCGASTGSSTGGRGARRAAAPRVRGEDGTIFLDGRSTRACAASRSGGARWRAFEDERFQPEGIRFAADDRWVVLGRLQIKVKEDGGSDASRSRTASSSDRKLAGSPRTRTSRPRSCQSGCIDVDEARLPGPVPYG